MVEVLLDSNLLVVLAIGRLDPGQLGRHKRARAYRPADFEILAAVLEGYTDLVLCPNVLTEASNLLRSADPSGDFSVSLAEIAEQASERYVPSVAAAGRPEYARLGLTDSVLLTLATSGAERRRVIDYLWSPVAKAVSEAGRER